MLIAARESFAVAARRRWRNPYVTDGLVAMWDGEWNAGGGVHDPNATTWIDLAGNCNVYDSRIIYSANTAYISGYPNTSLSLPDLPIFSGARTFCAVMRRKTGSAGQYSLSFRDGYNWYFLNAMRTYGCRDDAGKEWNTNTSSLADTQAFSVVVVRSDDECRIMINNVAYALTTAQAAVSVVPRIGFRNGEWYRLALYSRALTAAEIAANHAIDKERFNLP